VLKFDIELETLNHIFEYPYDSPVY